MRKTLLFIITIIFAGLASTSLFPPAHSAPVGTHYDHIVIIAMENQDYGSVIGNSAAPFINSMVPFGSVIPSYHSYGASSSISGCSAACYVTFTSGDTYGTSDGYGTISATNIADRLTAAGLTWKAFCENGCPRGNDHFPFTAYSDLSGNPNVITTSDDFTASTDPIYAELNSANPANYIFMTPTDSHNMHDVSVSVGDSYLQTLLVGSGTFSTPASGSVLATNIFKLKTELYLWWDEYDPSPNLQLGFGGADVKRGFTSSSTSYDEYASLHTIEANWGLPTLTAKDAGAPITSDIYGTSGPVPLSTGFTVSPQSPVVNLPVTFTSTTNGGKPPYSISWQFGDGATGTGSSVTHTYTSAQSFTVTETATDSASPAGTSTASNTVTVQPIPPAGLAAAITTNPTSPAVGQTISFTGAATGGTAPYTYSWDFGDGATATGSATTHSYSTSGSYTINLQVADSGTLTGSASVTLSVTATITPPVISVPGSQTVTAGTGVTFTVSATDPNAGATVTLTALGMPQGASFDSTSGVFSWTPGANQTGTYTIIFVATDNSSPAQSDSKPVTVQVQPASTTGPGGSNGGQSGGCSFCSSIAKAATNNWLLLLGGMTLMTVLLGVTTIRARSRLGKIQKSIVRGNPGRNRRQENDY